jgi:hypothetical protein
MFPTVVDAKATSSVSNLGPQRKELFLGDLHEPFGYRIQRDLHVCSGRRRFESHCVCREAEIGKGRYRPVANDSLTQDKRKQDSTCPEDT